MTAKEKVRGKLFAIDACKHMTIVLLMTTETITLLNSDADFPVRP